MNLAYTALFLKERTDPPWAEDGIPKSRLPLANIADPVPWSQALRFGRGEIRSRFGLVGERTEGLFRPLYAQAASIRIGA